MPPTIADQLRSERRRRLRRTRAALAVVAGLLAVGVVANAGSSDDPGGADARGSWSSWGSSSAPTTAASTSAPAPPATGLDPGLARAVEQAQAAAARDGHRLTVTSGFRTAEEQLALLDEEARARGSYEEALRWVFPPDRSMHVRGLAVDVGDGPAADWLEQEGARFGLCRTLGWEWWHFEWRERWEDAGRCPAPARSPVDAPGP